MNTTTLTELDSKINALFREKEEWEKAHGRGTWPMEKLYLLRDLTRERTGFMNNDR